MMQNIFYQGEGLLNAKTDDKSGSLWALKRDDKQNRSTAMPFLYQTSSEDENNRRKPALFANARPKYNKMLTSSVNAPLY